MKECLDEEVVKHPTGELLSRTSAFREPVPLSAGPLALRDEAAPRNSILPMPVRSGNNGGCREGTVVSAVLLGTADKATAITPQERLFRERSVLATESIEGRGNLTGFYRPPRPMTWVSYVHESGFPYR